MIVFLSTNPVFQRAAEVAQHGWVMGATTVLFFGFFVLWTVYAYAPWARRDHERNALIPFAGEED